MSPEAQKILAMFTQRQVRAGGVVTHWDFGDASPWGDEVMGRAAQELVGEGYLIEYLAGFGLTERGAEWLYQRGGRKESGARKVRSDCSKLEVRSMSSPKDGWTLSDAVRMVEQGYRPEQVQRLTGWASAHVLAQLPRRG